MGFDDAAALVSHKGCHVEIVPDFLLRLLQVALDQPVRKHGRLLDIRTLQHDNGNAARFNCHIHVHVGFGALIQIDVLRIAAAAGDDHIRLFFNGNAADFQQILATLIKGSLPVTGYHFVQAAVAGQHHIQQKVRINKGRTFHQVFMERVPFQFGSHGIGVTAFTRLLRQGQHMVVIDSFQACHARHHSFAPAAKTGHGMQGHGAGSDDSVRIGHDFIDIYLVSSGSGPHVNHVFHIPAVMLMYPEPFYHGFPQHQDIFFRRLGPMGTGGDNNIDIAVGDALIVQFFHNHRQELVRIAQAGLVADDDRHFFPRLHDLCQGFAVNGIAYCF